MLTYALNRRWTPPMPRLAVDGYWRAHPLRADRLARALAARSGTPEGWTWRLKEGRKSDLPASFRAPPAPFREKAFARGPGFCCVCGQPVYRLGWHAGSVGARARTGMRPGTPPASRRGGCGTRRATTPS